jgi:hypothetical protein
MKNVGRLFVRLGITFALAGLIASLVPTFVDRRDYAEAVDAYQKSPTRENRAVLAHESTKNRRIVLLTRMGVATSIFVIVNVGWVLVSRQRSRRPQEQRI